MVSSMSEEIVCFWVLVPSDGLEYGNGTEWWCQGVSSWKKPTFISYPSHTIYQRILYLGLLISCLCHKRASEFEIHWLEINWNNVFLCEWWSVFTVLLNTVWVSEYCKSQIGICSAVEVTVSSILCLQRNESGVSSVWCSSSIVPVKYDDPHLVSSVFIYTHFSVTRLC